MGAAVVDQLRVGRDHALPLHGIDNPLTVVPSCPWRGTLGRAEVHHLWLLLLLWRHRQRMQLQLWRWLHRRRRQRLP